MALLSTWRLVPAKTTDVHRWSYGQVRAVEDLYDTRIFGATDSLRCGCGKLAGHDHAGHICDECGVLVTSDAQATRKERLGHVELACCCRHPLSGGDYIYDFPVAPVAYRVGQDGSPNHLGCKYESLIQLNAELLRARPPKDAPEYHLYGSSEGARLTEAIAGLIGDPQSDLDFALWLRRKSCLLALVANALLSDATHVSALVRSCGWALELTARI